MKWLIGLGVVIAVAAGAFWYFVMDGGTPANAEGEFDIASYRALVASDAPETLPREVRVEFVGESEAPSFAAIAGDFSGDRTFAYVSFQVIGPSGSTIIDGAVDAETLNLMSEGAGRFDQASYGRVLEAETQAAHVMITHEHLDHVMAVARHPAPDAIAPRLALTRAQLDGLPEHAPGGVLAPSIAAVTPLDLTTPTRIAPGIVAVAKPGHAPGEIAIYVKTGQREYLFIGDIAWLYGAIERNSNRPRFIRLIMPGVDPDRPAVLRQIRALHELAAAEPALVIVPAHDDAHLRALVANGALTAQFVVTAPLSATPAPEMAPAGP
jgi:glyoxylase-like metal-dependent hydrolase (beta-lactamase superfamily II)